MLSRLLKIGLGLNLIWALGSSPLRAQLDPRLQAGKTDFLDLYQAGVRAQVKPEIVTLLDFSGSMNAIMFHPSFPNRADDEETYGTYYRVRVVLKSDFSGLEPASAVWRDWNPANFTALTSDGVNYTFRQIGLVKPNGDLVTDADAGSHVSDTTEWPRSSLGKKHVLNWIRAASHIRVEATFGATVRTLDLPIPWTVLDASSTGVPLQANYITDTKTSTKIELDTTHRGSDSSYRYLDETNSDFIAYIGASAGVPLYRLRYIAWLFSAKDASGNYIIPDVGTAKAFKNGIPARTRLQAIKEAVIRTWIKYQDKVFWVMRGLATPPKDYSYDTTTNTPAGIALPPGNATSGAEANWLLFNSDPIKGAQRLSKLVASGGTPLTRSMTHSYFQFQDPSPWDRVHKKNSEDDDQRPVDCLKHFLIAFTDGVPNPDDRDEADEANQPYGAGAAEGNKTIAASGLSSLDFKEKHWNIPTMAGVAAHGGDERVGWIRDPNSQSTGNSGYPHDFAPFFIKTRKDTDNVVTTFSTPHPIQTMTVGVSLGSNYDNSGNELNPATDSTSPKFRLLAAATFGDPLKSSASDLNVSTKKAFEANSNGTAKEGSVYYFDARDAQSLSSNLDKAIYAATQIAQVGVASAPVVPFSGLALARQIYLGNFQVPDSGPVWPGDLMMFPTHTEGLKTQILTNAGTVVDSLAPETSSDEAQWSAKKLMNVTDFWKNRTVYTRPSATVAVPSPGLVNFTDQAGTDFEAFKNELPAGSDSDRQKLVSWMRGADTSQPSPYVNRPNLMGDIIGSAPAVLEYGPDSSLASKVGAEMSKPGARLRVVFVGTNSGYLHAFGEFSWDEQVTVGAGSIGVTKAKAVELWSFLPTDFLPYIDYQQNSANPHRFMVDGTPSVYHLDLPATGKRSGNGKIDNNEKAVVVFGLRKGGRSYYALDVSDPLNPKMAWALRPDEATTMPDSRIISGTPANVRTLVQNMGFSTALPAMGRVLFTEGGGRRVKSATFLGGGNSVPEVEAFFKDGSGNAIPLGRSVFALETFTGNILQSWDLSGKTGIGPISAGVIPFEFFMGSGFVQRAYFTDKNGGVWALGSGQHSSTSPFTEFRLDSNDLDRWTDSGAIGGTPMIRKVYQGPTNDLHSTLPAPFNIGAFPVYRTTDPKVAPTAVGIAFVSGDRNNPVDLFYGAGKAPTRHRMNVVFDRQDSSAATDANGIQTGDMADMSAQTDPAADIINVSKASYYLKSKKGYYIDFPTPTTVGTKTYIPKGINEPTVLAGVLFYSYFKPTSGDLCSPGSGLTRSWRVCDVINPVVSNAAGGTSVVCTPGFVMEWAGVASNFGARGTVAVNQAGGVLKAGAGGDSGSGANEDKKVGIGTATGSYSETFPKPRVWRTVHGEN